MIHLLNEYITKRYERWLDYAKYHCAHAGMDEEAVDVLNEVLAMLLEKFKINQAYIMQLYNSQKRQYRELDFFILQMIKLNIQSPTSPYRHKYKSIPTDINVDIQRVDLIDEEDNEVDRSGIIFDQMQQVRTILDDLYLSDEARAIFSYKFFEGEAFSDWPGSEDKKYLYDTYKNILQMIKNKIKGDVFF